MAGEVVEAVGSFGFQRLMAQPLAGRPCAIDVALPDLQRDGVVPPRIRSELFFLDTGIQPGGLYTGVLTVRPGADFCIGLLRASAYVVNTALAGTPLAARRAMDAGVLLLSCGVPELAPLETANIAGGALIARPIPAGIDNRSDRLAEVVAGAGPLVSPQGVLYLEGSGGQQGVGVAGLTFMWSRTAAPGDADSGILAVHYVAVPRGCLPPLHA